MPISNGRALFGVVAAAGMALTARAAQATQCVNSTTILPPAFSQGAGVGCGLVANGTTAQVVFAFENAADSDTLLVAGMPNALIINNHTTPLGTVINLSTTPMEVLPLIFNDMSSKAFANAIDGGPAGFTGAATATLAALGGQANSEGYLNADPTSAAD